MIAESGFEFEPGFSGRVMENLIDHVRVKDTVVIMSDKIRSLFYWVNIPMVAALLLLMILFFTHKNSDNGSSGSDGDVTLNEVVYDFYLSNN